jgi:hypothetical protein
MTEEIAVEIWNSIKMGKLDRTATVEETASAF